MRDMLATVSAAGLARGYVMKKSAASLLIGLGLLAGCAAQTKWVKPGASEQDLQRDKNQCVYDATAAASGYGSGSISVERNAAIADGFSEGWTRTGRQMELAARCMRARGWALVPVASATSAGPIAP